MTNTKRRGAQSAHTGIKQKAKERLPTAREVFDQILWDPRHDAAKFTIGYQERMSGEGVREKPLQAWTPNGDIPWHRILYMKLGQEVVWDRAERVMALDAISQGDATQREAPKETVASINQPAISHLIPSIINTFYWDGDAWVETPQAHAMLIESAQNRRENTERNIGYSSDELTIATLNTLYDHHAPPNTDNDARRDALFASIITLNADVIALQEVCSATRDALLNHPYIRASYFTTAAEASRPQSKDLQRHGLLILSRFPIVACALHISPFKSLLIADLSLPLGQRLRAITLHLTSSRAANNAQKRAEQLSVLCDVLRDTPHDVIVLGDFNEPALAQPPQLTDSGLIDHWLTLHPESVGYTFDPTQNPLAAALSTSGRPARFDRILSRASRWLPSRVSLFAHAPPNDACDALPSDHSGVLSTLTPCPWADTPLSHHTALVIIPPAHLWEPIQAIRRLHDRHADRWMPHITLLYGFLPPALLSDALATITQALSDIPPFDLTLSDILTFTHANSVTLWRQPTSASPTSASPSPLQSLYQALRRRFPSCDEQQRTGAFTPHLTIAQAKNLTAAQQLITALRAECPPLRFTVTDVALIQRSGTEPFQIHTRFPLRTLNTSPHVLSSPPSPQPALTTNDSTQQPPKGLLHSLIIDACDAFSSTQRLALHTLGAHRLGTADLHSDLDLVCAIEAGPDAEHFFNTIAASIRSIGAHARYVDHAVAPVLKVTLNDEAIDLQYARLPQGVSPYHINKIPWNHLDQQSWRALVGCAEADAILAAAQAVISLDTWTAICKMWRAWTRERAIVGNSCGFPGHFSWAIALTWALQQLTTSPCSPKPPCEPTHLLNSLRDILCQAALNPQHPIGLTPAALAYRPRGQRDRWPIVTSTPPCQNSTRNLTRSTLITLQQVLARPVSEPPLTPDPTQPYLCLCWEDEAAQGWLESHLTGLILHLERSLNAHIRPWPAMSGATTMRVDITPPKMLDAVAMTRAFIPLDVRVDVI